MFITFVWIDSYSSYSIDINICVYVSLIYKGFFSVVENLSHPDDYCEIPHPDVGKYFQEFTGQYYVMNSEKAQEYPDDDQETRTVVEGRSH